MRHESGVSKRMAGSGVETAIAEVRSKATELRSSFGREDLARTLEWAAAQIEAGLWSDTDELLPLGKAAEISGYNPESLSRMVREGVIPDRRLSGSRGPIRIRRGDLPIKASRAHTPPTDVVELASRLGIPR